MKINAPLVFLLLISFHANVFAKPSCNPVVQISSKQTMLSDVLTVLAKENGFALSFPKNLDRKLSTDDSQPLNKMIEYLTRDLNTWVKHAESVECTGKKLVDLVIVPTGEDSELIKIDANTKQSKTVDYIYIEDMDAYARDVKAGKYRANLRQMTPEQRSQYKYSKRKTQKGHHLEK